jgi:hypothetical protein
MKSLLVSFVSDQTLPNVQFIKELEGRVSDYLFVTTEEMERKGTLGWIKNAAKIKSLEPIVVDQFSIDDITAKLSKLDYTIYNKVIVNLTGGTKSMTIASYDFFKEKGAEIYYLTGRNYEVIKLFPGEKKDRYSLNTRITLNEYLTAYGFKITPNLASKISFDQTERIFQKYINGGFEEHKEALGFLRRRRNKTVRDIEVCNVSSFLECIGFKTDDNRLSSQQVNYLTGEWFEEYIGGRIKRELNLPDSDILLGAKIRKNLAPNEELNSIKELLGDDSPVESTPLNEIDVMFMWNGKFHVIECKTSIISSHQGTKQKKDKKGTPILDKKGSPIEEITSKSTNILGDTIYKSDALKTKFGLFAKSYIFTLTDFKEYASKEHNNANQMIDLLNRATISKVKVVGKEQLLNTQSIKDLL